MDAKSGSKGVGALSVNERIALLLGSWYDLLK